jgi:hypothetical protein
MHPHFIDEVRANAEHAQHRGTAASWVTDHFGSVDRETTRRPNQPVIHGPAGSVDSAARPF